MHPVSFGRKAVQEQTVSSCALVYETRKADGDYLTEKLKIVPDKIIVEDKYVVDYPIDEPKTEPDKLCNSITKAVRASERLKKPPITKKNNFCMVKEKCSTDSNPLLVFDQNICGLWEKTDKFINSSLFLRFPHVFCFSEQHLKQMKLLENINLEANFVLHTVGNLY
jgi:hypothetical protein